MTRKQIKPGVVLFFIGLLLFEISNFFSNVVFIASYLKIIKFISFGIFIFSFFTLNKSKIHINVKNFFMILILMLLCFISYYKTASTMFIEILLISLNVINLEFKKVVKYDLFIKIFILIFLVSMSFMGLAKSNFVVTRNGEFIRDAYGFYHPNTFGMVIMMIFFEYLYLQKDKIGFKQYLIGALSVITIKLTSDTRTAIYCIIALLLFIPIVKKISTKKYFEVISKNLYIFLLITSLVLTSLYLNNPIMMKNINIFFSDRLKYQSYYLNLYNVNLFGNNIEYVMTLDNGFMKILLNYGLVIVLFFDSIFRFNIKKSLRNNDYKLCLIFLILILFSLAESSIFYIYNNIFLIYCFNNVIKKVGEN